jgi:O-antigen/teichoic acid export membrane protein
LGKWLHGGGNQAIEVVEVNKNLQQGAVHFFFARIGGVDGYGTLSLFLSLSLIFNNFTDFGVSLNGPRLVAQGSYDMWVEAAVKWRNRLAWTSALVYLIISWLIYPGQLTVLLAGLPMIASFSRQHDWISRGKGRPDRAALRQMLQSSAQLSGVGLVWLSGGGILAALLVYSASAVVTYLIANHRWRLIPRQTGAHSTLSFSAFASVQWPVFAGFMAQHTSYMMAIPILTFLSGSTSSGIYASHFFLFTSLGTLSVITMEVFMAKPGSTNLQYAGWMALFTLLATLLMLAAVWYFPILYGTKGFQLDWQLLLLNIVLLWVHAARLFWLNRLLFSHRLKSFGRAGISGLLLHVALWIVFIVMKQEVSPQTALSLLLTAEVTNLLILPIIKINTSDHERVL